MLRLSPPGFERLLQSPALSATFGGAEANVAVSLAHFGLESVLRHPRAAHAIGEAAVRRAARARGSAPTAIAARRRASRHLLRRDRRQPAGVDRHLRPRRLGDRRHASRRDRLARGARRGTAGFTSAASRRRSVRAPRARPPTRWQPREQAGATVSLDLNYRRKLWTRGGGAGDDRARCWRTWISSIANEEDLQSVLGLAVPGVDVHAGRVNAAAYSDVRRRVCDGVRPAAAWRSRCARACRPATTAGAPCSGTRRPRDCSREPALRGAGRRSDRRRRQLRGRD